MDNRKLFVAIGILAGVLIILIVISSLIGSFRAGSTTGGTPTPIPRTKSFSNTIPPLSTAQRQQQLATLTRNIGKISPEQQERLKKLQSKLPVQSSDFDLDYSEFLNQFYLTKKTPQADQKLAEFCRDNNISDICNNKDLFIETNNPVSSTKVIKENQYQDLSDEDTETPAGTSSQPSGAPTPGPTSAPVQNTQLLSSLFKTLLSFKLNPPNSTTSAGTGGIPTSCDILNNPKVSLSSLARGDIQNGIVDGRVINILCFISQTHSIAISVFKSGHRTCVGIPGYYGPPYPGCSPSDHYYGRAADIGIVDGSAVTPSNSAAKDVAQIVFNSSPAPYGLGQPWFAGPRPYFSDGDHQNHIHIGYR